MKFSCKQFPLIKAVNTVSKAASMRTTFEALTGILLTVKNNTLTLAASNIDLSIESSIDITNGEDGTALIGAKIFGEIIRKLPDSLITAEAVNDKFHISCLGSSFNLYCMDYDEFPNIGMVNQLKKSEINKNILISLIKKTSFAASPDEKKGILTGCLLSFSQNVLELAALDGFRIAVARAETGCILDSRVVIPARILAEISKILIDYDSEFLNLVFDDKRTEIICENTRIVLRLLNGEFLPYRDLFYSGSRVSAVVSRNEILSSIERASLFANEGKNKLIKMDIHDSEIEISSRSEEGSVKEFVSAETSGSGLVIGFNSKYITDALKAVDDDEIVFNFDSSTGPCIIKPVEGNSFTYLILPVRISA